MLSLAMVTLSPSSVAISSSAGAIIRHGPHHSAQKSTSTGRGAPSTSVAKLWSVTDLVAMAGESPVGLAAIWGLGPACSTSQFEQARLAGVEQRRADRPAREDHRKRLGISRHLGAMSGRNLLCVRRHPPGLEVDDRDIVVLDQQSVDRAGD